jgi:hypothetical protein
MTPSPSCPRIIFLILASSGPFKGGLVVRALISRLLHFVASWAEVTVAEGLGRDRDATVTWGPACRVDHRGGGGWSIGGVDHDSVERVCRRCSGI